jgi:hypothetical protein
MMKIKWRHFGVFVVLAACCAGCVEIPMYRMATDGADKGEYLVVGRVLDSNSQPIRDCRVFLSIDGYDVGQGAAAVTDCTGSYHIAFELQRCGFDYRLTFDARDQGYPIRSQSISHLLESSLFQYTGNNPVTMNVILNKSFKALPST